MIAVKESETIGMATPGTNAPTWAATTGSAWWCTSRPMPETAVTAGTASASRRPTIRHGIIAAIAAAMTGTAASSGRSRAITRHPPVRWW